MINLKHKTMAILIAAILTISIGTSITLLPSASAHNPGWDIPTYAYIVAEPDPVGVGQTVHVYMWLDPVYGDAGGSNTVIGENASTSSAALTANNYRFHNYQLTITAPDGTVTHQTFATIFDTTSSQFTILTPDQVGTYTFKFDYPGQVYGENGNGYEGSSMIGDSYLASSASVNLTVQEEPIAAPLGSSPLPTTYWTHPIYGEGTDWWVISSNSLGSGSPVLAGYTSSRWFQGDGIGPLTSHIMWTKPIQFGGVVGGNPFVAGGSNPNGAVQGVQYFEGSSYEPRYVNPIIINGYIFYTNTVSFTGATGFGGTSATGPTNCVDLRTGEVLWSRSDVPALSFGYIYNLWNGDQHGTFPPILFTSNFGQAFDAFTGDPLFNVTNVPSGTAVAGPSGEQLRYVIANAGTNQNPQWYLQEWNSSKLWQYDVNPYTGRGSFNPSVINASNGVIVSNIPVPLTGTTATIPVGNGGANFFVPYGSSITVDANIPINSTTIGGQRGGTGVAGQGITTYDWNVSLPWLDTMPLAPVYSSTTGLSSIPRAGTNPVRVFAANTGDVMLCGNGSLPVGFKGNSPGGSQAPYTLFTVNLNASRGAIGSILWMKTYDPVPGNITYNFGAVDWQTRVFTFNYEETLNWVGYSLDTGSLLWTSPRQADWDYYGVGNTMLSVLAYGKMYTSGFSGTCYCFNDVTGQLYWTYGNGGEGNTTNAGLSLSYGHYPTFIQSVSNGVIYLATNEHTIPNPLYKGTTFTAINATDGTLIWQLSGYPSEWSTPGTAWATADGYLTCMNGLDNNMYSIGRGPSTTSIQAPQTAITAGNKVVIQGTVIDLAAGTKQNQQAADFPNGVPCASDASMTDWMGYVYQQKPCPNDFTGVPVSIDAIDPNGNYIHMGDATSNGNGLYRYTWTAPNVPGDYLVTASFAGTNGYWPSSAQTGMTVTEATTVAPTAAPPSNFATTSDLLMGIAIAVIVLIIAIAIVGLLILRKRP